MVYREIQILLSLVCRVQMHHLGLILPTSDTPPIVHLVKYFKFLFRLQFIAEKSLTERFKLDTEVCRLHESKFKIT